MHDFDRLKLENNNKKFILSNTTEEDYGTYTADIYTSQEEVIMIDFHVFKYGESSWYMHVLSSTTVQYSIMDNYILYKNFPIRCVVDCESSGNI